VREHLLCVVPMEPCNGARALLIGIGRTVVGEEREAAVGTRIDTYQLCLAKIPTGFRIKYIDWTSSLAFHM
jgi:hypothetical protein